MNKIISIILSAILLFSMFSATLTVDAAAKNTVKTSITKIEPKAKGFKVTWKKKSKIKGYQIQYSTSSKFKKSSTKTKLVTKAKTKTATISKLKGCNKKYYVRVRTYKTSKGKKIYSSWSKAKSLTTLAHSYSGGACKYCNAADKSQKIYTLTEQQLRKLIQEEVNKAITTNTNSTAVNQAVAGALAKENEFVPGEELICPLGKKFNLLIDGQAGKIATITNFVVKAQKISDPNNPNDYLRGQYWRYIYQMELSGKIDPSYKIDYLNIYVTFDNGYTLAFKNLDSEEEISHVPVNSDGTFSINAKFASHKVEKYIYLYWIKECE